MNRNDDEEEKTTFETSANLSSTLRCRVTQTNENSLEQEESTIEEEKSSLSLAMAIDPIERTNERARRQRSYWYKESTVDLPG